MDEVLTPDEIFFVLEHASPSMTLLDEIHCMPPRNGNVTECDDEMNSNILSKTTTGQSTYYGIYKERV